MFINDCDLGDPEEENTTIFVNKETLSLFIDCIENSDNLEPSQKEAIIDNFQISVDHNTSLQCVGFAQAVADAQGIDLPDRCGNANGYINCPYIHPNRYTNEPFPGVFAVSGEGTWGHIGVITAVTTNEAGNKICRFASAWGNPDSTEGGEIDVTEPFCDSFNTFIKPN